MAQLIREAEQSQWVTRIGGEPNAPATTAWPQCKSCQGAMQFLAQIALQEAKAPTLEEREQVLLLFQCANNPGMCDDWDANSGGNAALLVPPTADVLAAPKGETRLSKVSRVSLESYDDSLAADTPDDNYVNHLDDDPQLLGKLGGVPLWIQGDETPNCSCGAPMQFVAQLEERGGGGMNFGDMGAGYAFVCRRCPDSAKFLWQCS